MNDNYHASRPSNTGWEYGAKHRGCYIWRRTYFRQPDVRVQIPPQTHIFSQKHLTFGQYVVRLQELLESYGLQTNSLDNRFVHANSDPAPFDRLRLIYLQQVLDARYHHYRQNMYID